MLSLEPSERVSAEEALSHSWFCEDYEAIKYSISVNKSMMAFRDSSQMV
jgi:hypothetical protein